MKKIIKRIFRYIGYILFRPIWWLERIVPRNKNIWVFGAWYGQKYSDNSKWLYEYVLEHNPEIKAIWITKNRDVYKSLRMQNKPVFLNYSIAGIWWCLKANYAFLTSGINDINHYFTNGIKQIWLWHGMPLKKILNTADEWLSVSKRHKRISKLLNPYQYFKPYATISSSNFFNKFLMDSFGLPENKILKTGLPRCDAFFTNIKEQLIINLKDKFNNAKVILYMPTFRMTSELNGLPFNPFDSKFKFVQTEFLSFLERENLIFLYKPHFVDSGISINLKSERFKMLDDTQFNDLYILLNSIDMLATDYSSVFFDFIPTKKPIILLPFDYDDYLKKSRSHFFNMFEEMTGIVCKDWNDFYNIMEGELISYFDFSKNNKFSDFLDGKSCEKLMLEIKKDY